MKQYAMGLGTGVLLVILLNPMVLSTSRMQAMVMLVVTLGAAFWWIRNAIRRNDKASK
jgi:hypothetical protein